MTDEEYVRAHWGHVDEGVIITYIGDYAFSGLAAAAEFAARRTRLLAPAKSVEERVTVQWETINKRYEIRVDDKLKKCSNDPEEVEIYRLGLIAKLKQ